MFSENVKAIRKAKGVTQGELAARLHVVRQTISKWEKGLPVPDAELLIRLAEVLDTTVSQLLGADIPEDGDSRNELADQLARINEQLAIRNRRSRFILRLVLGILGFIIVFNLILVACGSIVFHELQDTPAVQTTQLQGPASPGTFQ